MALSQRQKEGPAGRENLQGREAIQPNKSRLTKPVDDMNFTVNTAPLGLEDAVRAKLEALTGQKPLVSYQRAGGDEPWHVTADLAVLRSPMMITSTWSVQDKADISGRSRLHLASGLWVDLDDKQDITDAVKDLGKTAIMLRGIGIEPEQCSLFATGSKGFHLFIPLALIIPGGVSRVGMQTIRHWPALCKAFVLDTLITESTDIGIYNGGRGRQWRQVGIKRPNDAYKVPATWADALKLDAASYALLCSAPRDAVAVQPVLAVAMPAFAAWQKAYLRISAIVDAGIRLIVDDVSAPSWTRMECAQAKCSMYLNRPRSI